MRALTSIGVAFIAAVAVDLGLSLLSPRQWLPVPVCAAIGESGIWASIFLVPAMFVFNPAKCLTHRSLAIRVPLAVLVSWWMILAFRIHFSLPALREMARQRNDYDYDGVGYNAALLVMGWILPLIVTVGMVVGTVMVEQSRWAFRKRNRSRATGTPPGYSPESTPHIAE